MATSPAPPPRAYRWAAAGDVNAFFGLMLDNVMNLVILAGILIFVFGFPEDLVYTRMFPGTALGVMFGDLVYTWMAFRLAKKEGRSDVTAMPLGLDAPSTIGMAFTVLGPAYLAAKSRMPAEEAAISAWHVGMACMILIGIFKVGMSFVGGAIQRVMPGAGLLGSLAGIGIALMGVLQLGDILLEPVVGMISLCIIFYALIARLRLPFNAPGVLASVVAGAGVYYLMRALGVLQHPLPPPTLSFPIGFPLPTLGFIEGMGVALDPVPPDGDPVRDPHRRRRHQRDGERAPGRRRLPDARHPPHGGGRDPDRGRVRRGLAVDALHRPSRLQGDGRPRRLHAGLRALRGPGGHARLHPAHGQDPAPGLPGPHPDLRRLRHRGPVVPRDAQGHAAAVCFAIFPSVAQLLRITLDKANPVLLSSALDPQMVAETAKIPLSFAENFGVFVMLAHGFILTAMLWGAFLAFLIDHRFGATAATLGICSALVAVRRHPLRAADGWDLPALERGPAGVGGAAPLGRRLCPGRGHDRGPGRDPRAPPTPAATSRPDRRAGVRSLDAGTAGPRGRQSSSSARRCRRGLGRGPGHRAPARPGGRATRGRPSASPCARSGSPGSDRCGSKA